MFDRCSPGGRSRPARPSRPRTRRTQRSARRPPRVGSRVRTLESSVPSGSKPSSRTTAAARRPGQAPRPASSAPATRGTPESRGALVPTESPVQSIPPIRLRGPRDHERLPDHLLLRDVPEPVRRRAPSGVAEARLSPNTKSMPSGTVRGRSRAIPFLREVRLGHAACRSRTAGPGGSPRCRRSSATTRLMKSSSSGRATPIPSPSQWRNPPTARDPRAARDPGRRRRPRRRGGRRRRPCRSDRRDPIARAGGSAPSMREG